ncbi:hypothetical protein Acr_25g0006270 [Actinidia rufa]|uniref:Uncharacterized protein n=1 Tax=Actinidia rufa TaxID=165716 RepID=A0A7J0GZQ8_9ERIC|nr:hypothetical protein Acr_25g0006270 [Actinidia rufa]
MKTTPFLPPPNPNRCILRPAEHQLLGRNQTQHRESVPLQEPAVVKPTSYLLLLPEVDEPGHGEGVRVLPSYSPPDFDGPIGRAREHATVVLVDDDCIHAVLKTFGVVVGQARNAVLVLLLVVGDSGEVEEGGLLWESGDFFGPEYVGIVIRDVPHADPTSGWRQAADAAGVGASEEDSTLGGCDGVDAATVAMVEGGDAMVEEGGGRGLEGGDSPRGVGAPGRSGWGSRGKIVILAGHLFLEGFVGEVAVDWGLGGGFFLFVYEAA